MKKSTWAVVAGALFIVVVTTAVDVVLHLVGVFPPMDQPIGDGVALLATAYRVVFGVAGGWVTARVAPARPMKHALVLGAIGAVLGTIGVIATWNKGLGPHWYPISHVVLAIPECWLGARLFEGRAAGSRGRPGLPGPV